MMAATYVCSACSDDVKSWPAGLQSSLRPLPVGREVYRMPLCRWVCDRSVFDELINELASAYSECDSKMMKIVDRDVVAASFDFADLGLS